MQKGVDYIGVSAVPFLHDGNGNYLLGLRTAACRDEHFTWEPHGGGGVKFSEKLIAAVTREVKEEAGADAYDIEYLGFREVQREHEGKSTHWIAFDYRVRVDPRQVSIIEPHKCAELRWCKLDELPTPLHSQFPIFLNKYRDKLV